MGASNSKRRSEDLTRIEDQSGADINIEEGVSFRDMEGPSFYCAYLGFNALSKPPTNLNALQNPVKELYFKYRKTPASGRSANLKLIQKGVMVVLYENGAVKAELFLDFSSVTFVEAAKFVTVKTSSERKPKALFVPVDESKGAVSDKNAFPLDKSFHFLISSTHPPLVVCVVRRPTGVKALDCHVFALDTIENSLHISALIASAQMPSGQVNKMDSAGDLAKGKGGFDRGARGDVIRMEHGEYSVYRGPVGYETPPAQRYSGGPVTEAQPGQWYGAGGPVQSPGRNGHMGPPPGGHMGPPPGGHMGPPPGGHMGPAPGGPMMLSQENFREQPSSPAQPYGAGPGPGPKAYGMYDQAPYAGPAGAGYYRQPDVIMHTRQRSGDSAEHPTHDRSFSGRDPNSAGVQMRYDEVAMRNQTNNRLSGAPVNESRMSGGQVPPANRLSAGLGPPSGRISPRPNEATTSGGLQYSQWQNESSPVSPMANVHSPRTSAAISPTSPRGFDQRDFGPVYSASNLESRNMGGEIEAEEHVPGGRPVAKVPPHMIGVKVLPSDFRMVKLKPKTDKRPDAPETDTYDNNKEAMNKYKEIQEHPPTKSNNYPQNDGFVDFAGNKGRFDDRSKDYSAQWNDTVKDHKTGGRFDDYPNEVYRHGGPRDIPPQFEDNNNKSRFSVPVSYPDDSNDRRNWGQRAQSSYLPPPNSMPPDDSYARTKDLEIANMFSNFRVQGGNGRDMYRQPRERNEIEDGLGYLP